MVVECHDEVDSISSWGILQSAAMGGDENNKVEEGGSNSRC